MKKNGFIVFAFLVIFTACQQPVETGKAPARESTFEKDSLLIEVWDSSTPSKFLGYDTGMTDNQNSNLPIILTSTGYCVALTGLQYYGSDQKSYYGYAGGINRSFDTIYNENNKLDAGIILMFATASNPTNNDKAYIGSFVSYSRFVDNAVFYNPHNGGSYYTWNGTSYENVNFPPNFKIYDADGTIKTCNDETIGEPLYRGMSLSELVNETYSLHPLKRIGGYSVLGLPNPDDVKLPLVYKVQ